MPLSRTTDDVLALIHDEIVGRRIATFEIFGINALKTVTPTPAELAGDAVISASFDGRGMLQLHLGHARVEVDLARTGGLEFVLDDEPGARPTGRVTFIDGSRLDFKEPAKTKRITFSLWLS